MPAMTTSPAARRFAVKEATDGLRFVSRTVRSEGVTGLVERLPPALLRMYERDFKPETAEAPLVT